jgi:hypothetical protein
VPDLLAGVVQGSVASVLRPAGRSSGPGTAAPDDLPVVPERAGTGVVVGKAGDLLLVELPK